MRCRKVRFSLSTYSKGELPADLAADIKEHLSGCNSCRREAEIVFSMNRLVQEMPKVKTSSDFNARLMERVAREGRSPARSKAYLPGAIPRFNRTRLATLTATAVILLAVMLGVNFGGSILSPNAPMTTSTGGMISDDLYLTVQPTNNPFLNERKTVSDVVKQYNRWREYSKSLRSSGVEQYLGGTGSVLTSGQSTGSGSAEFRIRPVVRNYLITPENQTNVRRNATY